MNLEYSVEDVDVLRAIAFIIDHDETIKCHHSLRVAYLAKEIARRCLPSHEYFMYVAGLVHDIGIFDVPNKEIHLMQDLNEAHHPLVRTHPQKGAAIIAALPGFIPIAKAIMNHHEWTNGGGYPRGLTETALMTESQILRIADVIAFMVDSQSIGSQSSIIKEVTNMRAVVHDAVRDSALEVITCNDIWKTLIDTQHLQASTEHIFCNFPCVKKDLSDRTYYALLQFFGRLLDVKHTYTEGHSRRVSYYSVLLALGLDLPDDRIERLECAAYLHDIGKIAIPRTILDKKGPLTENEFEIIKSHAMLSYDIVKHISSFRRIADIVGADQEHWDGSGYPKGSKHEEIPIEARIIFVADAFDAMTTTRSYRHAMPVNKALDELLRCAGSDFDPCVVAEALKLLPGYLVA